MIVRAPNDRGQGRKPLPADKLRSAVLHVRVTMAEEEKFFQLGGRDWFRRALDKAKVKAGAEVTP
jgi:hypothetical protein